jgi:hypothetical protein
VPAPAGAALKRPEAVPAPPAAAVGEVKRPDDVPTPGGAEAGAPAGLLAGAPGTALNRPEAVIAPGCGRPWGLAGAGSSRGRGSWAEAGFVPSGGGALSLTALCPEREAGARGPSGFCSGAFAAEGLGGGRSGEPGFAPFSGALGAGVRVAAGKRPEAVVDPGGFGGSEIVGEVVKRPVASPARGPCRSGVFAASGALAAGLAGGRAAPWASGPEADVCGAVG